MALLKRKRLRWLRALLCEPVEPVAIPDDWVFGVPEPDAPYASDVEGRPDDLLFNIPDIDEMRQRCQPVLVLKPPTQKRKNYQHITYDGEESTRRLLALCKQPKEDDNRERSKSRT